MRPAAQRTRLAASSRSSARRRTAARQIPHLIAVLLDYDLTVHPRVRRADVIVVAGLVESDLLRLAGRQRPGVPVPDLPVVKRCRRMRRVARIGEGHSRPRLDAVALRKVTKLDIVVADFDRVDILGNRSAGRSRDRRRRWRRPQRVQLPLQREGPHGIAGGAADPLITSGCDGDVLIPIDLVDHWSCLRAKTGLELPKQFAGLCVTGLDCPARITVEDEAASRRGRSAATADAERHIFLPGNLVGIAANRGPVTAHGRADRCRLRAAVVLSTGACGL